VRVGTGASSALTLLVEPQ